MIPDEAMYMLDSSEPEMGRLISELGLMQSRGQWSPSLTNRLCNFLESLVQAEAFTAESLDKYLGELTDFVDSVKEATK